MPNDQISVLTTAAITATAYVAQKLFGKTLEEMGDDLNKAYKKNREKIIEKAAFKIPNPDDGAQPNLRVARDVLWNGAVTDDEVCAEYFGGLLASSRSVDGKDDSALIYVDCIKALSSKQLHLHYVIYSTIQNLLLSSGKTINPGLDVDINAQEVWIPSALLHVIGLRPEVDLNILHRQGLLYQYSSNNHIQGSKALPYISARPTTFGVLLYAAAMNQISAWNYFGRIRFPVATEIQLPTVYTSTLPELLKAAGLNPDL
jgi:hypothetical protein